LYFIGAGWEGEVEGGDIFKSSGLCCGFDGDSAVVGVEEEEV
jgi:hypothetical protein